MGATPNLLLAIIFCVVVGHAVTRRWQRRAKLPPGPKGVPILGNIFDIPEDRPWIAYRDGSLQYDSDMIYLDLPRQPTIVLNSLQAATDLMEKRSRNYSDKPFFVMDEITGWDWNLGLMAYGPRWRDTRRTFHQCFNSNAVKQYHPVQTREVHAFLKRAIDFTDNIDLVSVSQTYAAIIFDIIYSIRITDKHDKYVLLSQKAVEGLSRSRAPGAFWVEYFPLLKYIPSWVPGSSARKLGDQYKPFVLATRDEPYNDVLQAMADGTVVPSIVQRLIQRNNDRYAGTPLLEAQNRIARDATGIAYAAAADTQNATTSSFFLLMAMTPSAQRKAQLEMDAMIGSARLPTMEDIPSLPYIQAILMEVMRWAPVLPLGVPHCASDDDEYNGFFIPKGTVVTGNVWAMLHNPTDYPDPETFNPDRFIRDGEINPDVPSPDAFFGFGRRVCPGRYLAKDTLLLMFASILHIFDIEPTSEEKIIPKYTTGLFSVPESLPCCLKPRNVALLDFE